MNRTVTIPLSIGVNPALDQEMYFYEYTTENEDGSLNKYREWGDKEWAEKVAAEYEIEMPTDEA